MDDLILTFLENAFKPSLLDAPDTNTIAQLTNLSRNRASSYLNNLVKENYLVKINSRPVTFFHRNKLEDTFQTVLLEQQYDSIVDLQKDIEKNKQNPFIEVIGHDSSLENIIFQCKAAVSYSQNGLPIMLVGESGTGKSYLTEKIYHFSKFEKIINNDAPFIHINCSDYADNPDLFLANLFGFVKGAYTGADKTTTGLLAIAQNGYLFLDEIHSLNSACQEKLFQFMDSGKYHQLGDNDRWYFSNVRLLFATTEYPSKKLLNTFLRRIPVILTIPSLNERNSTEKTELISYLLKKEEQKVEKEILIESNTLEFLLTQQFPGNVGELSNILKLAVATESYSSSSSDKIFINQSSLRLKSYTLESLNEKRYISSIDLINYKRKETPLFALINQINQEELFFNTSDTRSLTNFFKKIWGLFIDFEKTFSQWYFDNNFEHKKIEIAEILQEKITKNNSFFSFSHNKNEFEIIAAILAIISSKEIFKLSDNINLTSFQFYINQSEILMNKQYNFSSFLVNQLNFEKNEQQIMAKLVTLSYIEMFSISSTQNQYIGLVMSHGRSIATEIANTINQMLNSYIYDSINLPLDVTFREVDLILEDWIATKTNAQTIIIFSDMGSLTTLNTKLTPKNTNANIMFINSINPPLLLALGNELLQKAALKQLETVAHDVNSQFNVSTVEKNKKEYYIICSSGSGLDTDKKLKRILEKSLPSKKNIKVKAMSFENLVTIGFSQDFLDKNEVKFVLGTLDPNISNIPFVSIGDLIADDSITFLSYTLSDVYNKNELKILSKNLLNEFALTNLVNQLTILDPKKLLSLVTVAIDDIQKQVKFSIPINTSLGLYIHTCCMIERLIRMNKNDIEDILDKNDTIDSSFNDIFNNAFSEIEIFYSVEIPLEEKNYIYNYIYND